MYRLGRSLCSEIRVDASQVLLVSEATRVLAMAWIEERDIATQDTVKWLTVLAPSVKSCSEPPYGWVRLML